MELTQECNLFFLKNNLTMFILDILMVLQMKTLLKIRKNESLTDVKWSAFLFTSFVISQLLISLILVYSIYSENQMKILIANNLQLIWFGAMLLSPLLIYFRYYKRLSNEALIIKYESLNRVSKQLMKVFSLMITILIPLISFIVHRLFITSIQL